MKTNNIYWLAALVMSSLVAACSDEIKEATIAQENRTVVFTLEAPDDEAEEVQTQTPTQTAARRAHLKPEDFRSYSVYWKSGDGVVLFFESNNRFYKSTGYVVSTSDNGKTAQFSAQLPKEIDIYSSYRVYGICGKDGEVVGNTPRFYASMFRTWDEDFEAPVWFSTSVTLTKGWPTTIKCSHLGAYEVLHFKNKTNNTVKVNFDGFKCTTPWYNEYAAFEPVDTKTLTGMETVPISDFQDANKAYREVPSNSVVSFYSWYIPSGTKMKSATLEMTIDGKKVSSSNKKTSSVTLLKGRAYHLYATWDGEKLTQGLDAYKDPLRLSVNQLTMPLDGDATVDILSGNGSYSVSTTNEKIADAYINQYTGAIRIYSQFDGRADITVTDLFTSETQVINVRVVKNSDTLYGRIMQEMILVEPGEFIMGDPDGKDEDASPAHKVTITKPFYIGKFEITNKIYEQVMYDTPVDQIQNPNYALEMVMRYQIVEFINKLREKTQKAFRLPTNAEWEYAARGGKYSKGYKFAGSNVWADVSREKWNSPVGTKRPNELGIYDMTGGMAEWVQDNPYSYTTEPEIDPLHFDPDNQYWIIRWCGNNKYSYVWSWVYYGGWANSRSDFGMRIVLPYE